MANNASIWSQSLDSERSKTFLQAMSARYIRDVWLLSSEVLHNIGVGTDVVITSAQDRAQFKVMI